MVRINLDNYRERELYYKKLRVVLLFGVASMLALALNLLIYSYYQVRISAQQRRNTALITQLHEVDVRLQPLYEWQQQLTFLNTRSAFSHKLAEQRSALLDFLQQINTLTPAQIYFKQLNWQATQVNASGVSASPVAEAAFLAALRAKPRLFYAPQLKSQLSSSGVNYDFTLMVGLKAAAESNA